MDAKLITPKVRPVVVLELTLEEAGMLQSTITTYHSSPIKSLYDALTKALIAAKADGHDVVGAVYR